MMIVNINTIYAFNMAGVRIVKIDGRCYVIDSFWEAATQHSKKHKLIGKDITEILSESSQFANKNFDMSQIASSVMKFQDIKSRTIEFHESVEYVLYT